MNTPSISNMFSARETSRDASFVKLVNSIFTEKTVSEINKEWNNQKGYLSSKNLSPSYDSEKCMLFIRKFYSDNELVDTDFPMLDDYLKDVDASPFIRKNFLSKEPALSVKELKTDPEAQVFKSMFDDAVKVSGEDTLRLLTDTNDEKFDLLSKIINLDSENIDKSKLKSLSIDDIFSMAKSIGYVITNKFYEDSNDEMKSYSEQQLLIDMAAARNVVNKFPTLWKKLYLLVNSPIDFGSTVTGIGANQYMKQTSKSQLDSIMPFYIYAKIHSEKWKEYQFGLNFIECVKDPMNLVMLVEFISKSPADGGSPYSNCFCKNFDAFLKEKGYDLNIDFLSFIKEQPLMKDKDPGHKTWYINILNSKVDGTLNDELNYNKKECVKKLYAKMKENGYIISNCTEDLFVYRFTGFGTAYDPKEYIITVNLNNAELGYLIRCLLSDERNTPDGLTCAQNFFISKRGKSFNLAYAKAIDFTITNNEQSLKEHFDNAVQLLTDCGFVNVDKIYLKGSRGEYKKKS